MAGLLPVVKQGYVRFARVGARCRLVTGGGATTDKSEPSVQPLGDPRRV
jgi:hypothetical protein